MPILIFLFILLSISFTPAVSAQYFDDDDADIISESEAAPYFDQHTVYYSEAESLPEMDESEGEELGRLSKESGAADSKLPRKIPAPGEKVIVIDPRLRAWGAYSSDGQFIHGGKASAGANWCADVGRPCRTKVGSFRIFSLGDSSCVSSLYPLGEGGAPMPYCMFFNGNQGLHGSYQVGNSNRSHGCVRVSVNDAAWLRYQFARKGTKVIVKPYR